MSKDKLKFFFDTEFMETGRHLPLELLSIGIVCENGQQLYLENMDARIELANDFVVKNVFPYLKMIVPLDNEVKVVKKRYTEAFEQDECLFHIQDVGEIVREWIFDACDNAGNYRPEFWGYFCDYDWVLFCQLFGIMAELPKGFPYWCRDLKQLMEFVGIEESLDELVGDKSIHNALADAKQIKKGYEIIDARFDLKRNRFRNDK